MNDKKLKSNALRLAADVERRAGKLAARLLAAGETEPVARLLTRANLLVGHLRDFAEYDGNVIVID